METRWFWWILTAAHCVDTAMMQNNTEDREGRRNKHCFAMFPETASLSLCDDQEDSYPQMSHRQDTPLARRRDLPRGSTLQDLPRH
uniref:Secreted protein n=1 Tax=Steinernema glaseri TaxID=37863 RepID=A0A1I7YNY5_9BILA